MTYSAGDLQVGFGIESTWGTAVTPTRTFEVVSEAFKASYDRIDSKGIRTSRVLQSKTGWATGKVDVNGEVELELPTKGLGMLLSAMVGTATATGTGTTAKTYVYNMTAGATTDGKGLTAEVSRADIGGTRQVFTYAGLKVQSWEVSAAQGELCMLKLSLDGKSETLGTTVTTAAYPTSLPFVFTGAAISVGGSTFECKQVSVKGDNALKVDRYALGDKYKKEQVQSGLRSITGSLTADFNGVTAYNRVVNGDVVAFEAKFESAGEIATGVKASLTINIPDVRFEGDTPTGGGQLIDQTLNFVALDDESGSASPCVITYVTLDAAA